MLYQTLTVFTVLCFLVYFNHRCNSKHSVRKAIAHTGALFCSSWYDSEHLDPQYFHSLVLLQNGIVRLEYVFFKKKKLPLSLFSKDLSVFFAVWTAIVQFLLGHLEAAAYFLCFFLWARFLWFLLWRIRIANEKPWELDFSGWEFTTILLSSITFLG